MEHRSVCVRYDRIGTIGICRVLGIAEARRNVDIAAVNSEMLAHYLRIAVDKAFELFLRRIAPQDKHKFIAAETAQDIGITEQLLQVRCHFHQDLVTCLVAQAVSRVFHAEKMNYELLGMGDSHLHWHLFPRKSGDIGQRGNRGKGPVWCVPMDEMYDEKNRPSGAELEEMRRALGAEIDRLLSERE